MLVPLCLPMVLVGFGRIAITGGFSAGRSLVHEQCEMATNLFFGSMVLLEVQEINDVRMPWLQVHRKGPRSLQTERNFLRQASTKL